MTVGARVSWITRYEKAELWLPAPSVAANRIRFTPIGKSAVPVGMSVTAQGSAPVPMQRTQVIVGLGVTTSVADAEPK